MSTVTTLGVTGMTCGNCVSHVTKDVGAVAGVENISVDLNVGGASEVTVFSDDPLDEAALREAVDEAGYEVTSYEVQLDAQAAQSAEQAADRKAHNCGCGCGTDSAADAAPAVKTYDLQVPQA
ncbi:MULTISPECIES: heavy-metal-associated domain-containing protein [Oerskovia]|uniref:Copper exporting ATPase n=1 Tax=Oerskovia enterophila TaxID=43678 RepID=A0A163SJZ9_9CELL|nr:MULTISPECIES: heavy metal-associated domain-containing protein [Oerskovia]KZM36503.1 copper exporting ATPase [Oerskovia enterophila]OCI32112.1 copper exporting ATPase [Oerskovia enterophila]